MQVDGPHARLDHLDRDPTVLVYAGYRMGLTHPRFFVVFGAPSMNYIANIAKKLQRKIRYCYGLIWLMLDLPG